MMLKKGDLVEIRKGYGGKYSGRGLVMSEEPIFCTNSILNSYANCRVM